MRELDSQDDQQGKQSGLDDQGEEILKALERLKDKMKQVEARMSGKERQSLESVLRSERTSLSPTHSSGVFAVNDRRQREMFRREMQGEIKARNSAGDITSDIENFEKTRNSLRMFDDSNAEIVSENLTDVLKRSIQSLGPMSLRQFIKQALTHPLFGYYSTKTNVFGKYGDFITSPELSPIFGEVIGIWCHSTFEALGFPKELNLVEFGPGKGTLIHQVLKIAKYRPDFFKAIRIHLIEDSSKLRMAQYEKLFGVQPSEEVKSGLSRTVYESVTPEGVSVSWHKFLETVPQGPVLVLAHEFFDALPVYQLEYRENGWKEVVVVWDREKETFQLALQRTVSAGVFTNSRAADEAPDLESKPPLVKILDIPTDPKVGHRVEFCPDGLGIAQEISDRIAKSGGAALVIDYGNDHPVGNSLRGIANHQFVDFLKNPGECDITSDVDFSSYRRAFGFLDDSVAIAPLFTQSEFLRKMGIDLRAEALLEKEEFLNSFPSPQEAKSFLQKLLNRLVGVGEENMGEIYKVMIVHHKKMTLVQDAPILTQSSSSSDAA